MKQFLQTCYMDHYGHRNSSIVLYMAHGDTVLYVGAIIPPNGNVGSQHTVPNLCSSLLSCVVSQQKTLTIGT